MSTTTAVRATINRTRAHHWDEPAGASSPRGWLHHGGRVVGFYLDYGPDHYRSPHAYCHPTRLCPTCQPGNVLAVVVAGTADRPGARASRWFETVHEARVWVESRTVWV